MNRAERRLHAKAERRVLASPHWRRELTRRIAGDMQQFRAEPLSEARQLGLWSEVYRALSAVPAGAATSDDTSTLITAFGISSKLAQAGYGPEAEPIAMEGMQACAAVHDRGLRTGRFGATGQELQALQAALDAYSEQLAMSPTRGEMRQILRELAEVVAA